MEKNDKKNKFNAFISSAGKTAKDIFESTVQAVDQNDDGKFDLTDVSVIAGAVGNATRKGAMAVADSIEENARKLEFKTLRPIFTTTLDETEFLMPKFIRLGIRDKRHMESEVCKGSIGHIDTLKGNDLVNIYQDSVDAFRLKFIPDMNSEFYYIDPSDRDCYIALDDYFNYLKIARVTELQTIAQALGAKYFKITYKEEKTSFSDQKLKSHMKTVASIDADHHHAEKEYSKVEIAAEMSFPGHEPIKPELKYLQNDPSIQSLVAMRLNENSPLLEQKFTIHLSHTSGLKEKDAAKIDTILKGLKCSGNATVESEARNESRRVLEYDVKF